MPKYQPRHLPPKEAAQLREVVNGQSDMKAQLDFIAMMAEVDLDALSETDDTQEVADEQEV